MTYQESSVDRRVNEPDSSEIIALLWDMTDWSACWFDHHGHCQQHGWTGEGKCHMKRAQEILSALGYSASNGPERE